MHQPHQAIMANTTSLSRKIDDLLPAPPKENLTTHFILGEIISQIDLIKDDFPLVKIQDLKSHLWDIRNQNINPEKHLRGFLKVFEDTHIFQDALTELDPKLKAQLKAFMNGANEKIVMGMSDQKFELPASPPVKHHFKEMVEGVGKRLDKVEDKIDEIFHHGYEGHHHTEGLNGHIADIRAKIHEVKQPEKKADEAHPKIFEDVNSTQIMEVHSNAKFQNWGQSVNNTPRWTFVPKTVLGIQNLVIWARSQNLRVRVGGYRHSWSSTFSQDKHILISLLNLEEVTRLPDDMSISAEGNPEKGELRVIELAEPETASINVPKGAPIITRVTDGEPVGVINGETEDWEKNVETVVHGANGINEANGPTGANGHQKHDSGVVVNGIGTEKHTTKNALVRVGVSVTNEQFRRWAVGNDKWTLPVDVILVEVTIGGVNGPICHGAGRQHKTVNDHVRQVEYVDCNGVHRTISDPEKLKAAAGHFGLLGIVTHITFELAPMRYAVLQPFKPDINLAIPPLSPTDVPVALRKSFTKDQYSAALADFTNRATNDYYSEWFWFTRSEQAWVNTWNPVEDKEGVVDYPSPFLTWLQWVEGWLGMVITTNPIFNAFPGRWQATLLATFGMVNLPPFDWFGFEQNKQESIKCALPNALHFRRGIQNMRVRDLEFQIPIPSLPADPSKPDFSIVQKAWWDIINLCYEDDDCPMRLTMELRIMGGSDLIMAPQNGNVHGTASIEVLSVPDVVADDEWVPFLQRVADLWLGYKDGEGTALNVRPHWAKEWESINMRGKPARQYLKEVAYKDAIPEFKRVLASIGAEQGWELKDIQSRFSNELWDYMIYS